MKKLIRIRVVALLCLFFRRRFRTNRYARRRIHLMQREKQSLNQEITRFFKRNPPEMVRYFTFIIFQCWALNDCREKNKVSDEDFALFLDQLNDFVGTAYRYLHLRSTTGT